MDLPAVAYAWIAYALVALAFTGLVAQTRPRTLANLALGILLVQQAAGALLAVAAFSAGGGLGLLAFRAGVVVWVLWAPAVALAAPLFLRGSTREPVAWAVAAVVGLPGLVLLAASAFRPDALFAPGGAALSDLGVVAVLLAFPALALTVALLAWEAGASRLPLRRARLGLVAAALAGEGAFHAGQNASKLLTGLEFHGIMDPTTAQTWIGLFPLFAFAALAAWGVGLSHRAVDDERRRFGRMIALIAIAAAITGAVSAPIFLGDEHRDPVGFLHAAWDLGALALLFYGAMRHQLFSIEKQARRGLAVSSAVLLGVLAFAAAQNVAEEFVATSWLSGVPAAGAFAAIVVAAASIPLGKVASKAASKALPAAEAERERRRREEVYRAALEGVLLDGVATSTELNSLRRLRETLRLSLDDHVRIEGEVRVAIERERLPATGAAPASS